MVNACFYIGGSFYLFCFYFSCLAIETFLAPLLTHFCAHLLVVTCVLLCSPYVFTSMCTRVLPCLSACVLGVLACLACSHTWLACWLAERACVIFVLTCSHFFFVCCDKMFYELISSCAWYFLFVLLSLNFKLNFKNSFTEKCLKKIVKVGLSRLRKFLPN